MEFLSGLYSQFWDVKSNVVKMREKFLQIKGNQAYIFLCATIDSAVVGTVTGVVCEDLYGECRPFLVLENMVVDKNFRKCGVGRALFAELESRAEAAGCARIMLVTDSNREAAHRFYESLGFHPTNNKGYKKKIGGKK